MLFRIFVRSRVIDDAREQASRGIAGSMEGHAAMDISVQGKGSFWRRLVSPQGFTAVSHVLSPTDCSLGRGGLASRTFKPQHHRA